MAVGNVAFSERRFGSCRTPSASSCQVSRPNSTARRWNRFFTLSDADLAEVRRRRGDSNRLGWALQLCGLWMLCLLYTSPSPRDS